MCHPDAPAVGIDVCKHHLDAHLLPQGETRRFDNTPQGIESLIAFIHDADAARVVLESTGGYERQLLYAALAQGLPVARVNPRPVRPRNANTNRKARIRFRGRRDRREAPGPLCSAGAHASVRFAF